MIPHVGKRKMYWQINWMLNYFYIFIFYVDIIFAFEYFFTFAEWFQVSFIDAFIGRAGKW